MSLSSSCLCNLDITASVGSFFFQFVLSDDLNIVRWRVVRVWYQLEIVTKKRIIMFKGSIPSLLRY